MAQYRTNKEESFNIWNGVLSITFYGHAAVTVYRHKETYYYHCMALYHETYSSLLVYLFKTIYPLFHLSLCIDYCFYLRVLYCPFGIRSQYM